MQRLSQLKYVIVLGVFTSVLLRGGPRLYADPLSDLKKKISNLQHTITDLEKKNKDLIDQRDELKRQADGLSTKTKQLEKELDKVNEALKKSVKDAANELIKAREQAKDVANKAREHADDVGKDFEKVVTSGIELIKKYIEKIKEWLTSLFEELVPPEMVEWASKAALIFIVFFGLLISVSIGKRLISVSGSNLAGKLLILIGIAVFLTGVSVMWGTVVTIAGAALAMFSGRRGDIQPSAR